jgi:D-galactarolactone cycloisomerase
LKITNIETRTLVFRYPSEDQYLRNASGFCNARVTTLVWVHTDEGITGIGSVYSHPDLVRIIVEGHLRDIYKGRDALEIECLWELGYELTRWYGRKGVAMSVIGGIDMALWDIRGKAEGKPLYQLLGGERDHMPAYASGLVWQDDFGVLRREAQQHVANGFHAMKMRIGRDPDYDRQALVTVRDAIGSEICLMADANSRYTPADVDVMIPMLKDAALFWLEEPFPMEQIRDYARLRASGQIDIAAGENEFGVQGFRELIEPPLVTFAQPDCCRAGGVTECNRIGRLAAAHGIGVATHTWSDAVALTANLHLVTALANGVMVEVDQTGNRLITDLLEEPLRFADGCLYAPSAPGLGITLSEDALEKYGLPPQEPIPPGNYADMAFGASHYGTSNQLYART